MTTPTRAERKPQRSFVPIAPFGFERFEVPVQRVTRREPPPIGVIFGKANMHRASTQFRPTPGPTDAVHRTKILLPSPSHQGHGLTCSRLRARPVDYPVALSSRKFRPTRPNPVTAEARQPDPMAPALHLK